MPVQSATVRFAHIHVYCDPLKSVDEYAKLGAKLNDFQRPAGLDRGAGRAAWVALAEKHGNPCTGASDPETWKPFGQDPVEQQIVGLGWRVTGAYSGPSTRSVLVNSSDPRGVKFVFTAHNELKMSELIGEESPAAKKQRAEKPEPDPMAHFDAAKLACFAENHVGRQGVAVLAFEANKGDIDVIQASYAEKHPKLLTPGGTLTYADGTRILEVYAYYQGLTGQDAPDVGTILRFIEPPAGAGANFVLPGIEPVEAAFDGVSLPVYFDHWVSNVLNRDRFLSSLEETMGFSTKVNFNAGVVAAGEAQIESTVTGNSSVNKFDAEAEALVDQSQVYLPTNNALSEVGHVSIYLREIGQGVQHIACRVSNLVAHIQRCNDNRMMTGAGLAFLMIPRSYYGMLDSKRFAQDAGLEQVQADACVAAFKKVGFVDARNIVDLDVTVDQVRAALPEGIPDSVVEHVRRARYANMQAMLQDHFTEEEYISIVRNNILIDIQGEDILMQIFTEKILKAEASHEAPFWEFIQRSCKQKGEKLAFRPGCGGFGIRNFLTLFLSIEVSKAAAAQVEAQSKGDAKAEAYAIKMVEAFTAQLDESNPVLTGISNAMTAAGLAEESGDKEAQAMWNAKKVEGNGKLQEVSSKYNSIMKKLREEAQ